MADVAVLTLQIVSNQAERSAERMTRRLDRMDMSATKVGRTLRNIGLGLTAAVTAPIALMGRAAVKTAAQFEQSRIAFGVFLGDVRQGAAVFERLTQFAARTPLELGPLSQAAQILLATGTAGNQLFDVLKSIGDVSRGDSAILQRLALNLSQVQSQGKLTGRELRDFAVAGVPLVQELAAMYGKTTEQIAKMVSAGQVGADRVFAAFRRLTGEGGRFENLLARMANTLGGKWTTAMDSIRIAAAGAIDTIRPILKNILDIVINLANQFNNLNPAIKKVIVTILGIAAAVGPILASVGGLILLIAGIKVALIAIAPILAAISVVALKVVVAVGLIAAAVEVVRRSFGITWREIGQGALDAGRNILGFILNIRKNWTLLIDWLSRNWKNILTDMLRASIIFAANLAKNIATGTELVAGIWGALTGWIVDNWEIILGQIINKIVEWGKAAVKLFFNIGRLAIRTLKSAIAGADFQVPNMLDQFIEGSAKTGTLQERLKKVFVDFQGRFVPLLEGFEATTEPLPKFLTDFQLMATKFGETLDKGISPASPGEVALERSDKLAEALLSGSKEAFSVLTGGATAGKEAQKEKTQKDIKKNTADSAQFLQDLTLNGIEIKATRIESFQSGQV